MKKPQAQIPARIASGLLTKNLAASIDNVSVLFFIRIVTVLASIDAFSGAVLIAGSIVLCEYALAWLNILFYYM